MHRALLLSLLERYLPQDALDHAACQEIREFVLRNPACFERTLEAGHVTGSAWLLDSTGKRALLTHHRKLNQWLQLGGHSDGDPDTLRVALREAQEESGISDIRPLSQEIFDLDWHRIPARGSDPEHIHYDVRFLFQVRGSETFAVSDESNRLQWFHPQEIRDLVAEPSILRMVEKWEAIFKMGEDPLPEFQELGRSS